MKTKAICSFFVLFAIVAGMITAPPAAFADPHGIETADNDLAVPGCGETEVGCYTPNTTTVDVGHIVTMTNTDEIGIHTFTSGTVDGFAPSPDGIFDSGMLMKPGDSFEYSADTVGEFPYYCTLHVWMQGVLIVQEAAAEEEMQMEEVEVTLEEEISIETSSVEETIMEETTEEETMMEAMMSGVNLDLDIDPMLPFDNTVSDMVTLSFTAKSDALKGSGTVDHLDYKVIISKDGNEVWSEQFHEHDGNLELQITPSEGSFTVTGGEEVGSTETKAFMVQGPVFMDNGNYQVTAQIVGIEFNPLSTPLTDDFNIQVVPEFGTITMMVLAVAIISIIAITAKSRVIPRL